MDKTKQNAEQAEAGPSTWEEFSPEVTRGRGFMAFKFRCPRSGSFRCTRTGLVFVVDGEAGLEYRTIFWDVDLLRSAGSMAAGPMLKIDAPEDALRQIYFPHCEAKPEQAAKMRLCVVQVTDDGMSFIRPLKTDESHVLISYSGLSKYGLLERSIQYVRKVRSQIVLVIAQRRPNYTPNSRAVFVLLLPINVIMDSVKYQHTDYHIMQHPDQCELIRLEEYSVQCPESVLIQPTVGQMDMEFGPNYHPVFQVNVPPDTERMTLTVLEEGKKNVWEKTIDLPGPGPV